MIDEVKDQPVEQATSATEVPRAPAPEWLEEPEPPARGELQRDRTLLDLLPTGILIYRLDRLLYANPTFLKRIGYDSLHALEQAGGLDALYVEAGVSSTSSTSEAGTPVTISASHDAAGLASAARLFTIAWDGESALALMFTPEAPPRARRRQRKRPRPSRLRSSSSPRPAMSWPRILPPSSTPPPKAS